MARNDPQFRIRLPPDLKARIEGVAKQNKRSLNSEITMRLEASFQPAGHRSAFTEALLYFILRLSTDRNDPRLLELSRETTIGGLEEIILNSGQAQARAEGVNSRLFNYSSVISN